MLIVQGKFIADAQVDGEPLREVLGAWMRLQYLAALQKDSNEKLKVKLEAVRKALEEDYRVDFELLTTGVLTDAAKSDFKAYLFRVYEIPDRALADRISINANSESAVKPRDLRSNDKVLIGPLPGRLLPDEAR